MCDIHYENTLADETVAGVWDDVRLQLGGHSYSAIDQGEQSLVLLVNEHADDREPAYIVKIPRANTPQLRQWAAYEGNVVRHINQSPEIPPVEVPTFLAKSFEPDQLPWYAYSYVSGNVLTYAEIHEQFSEREMNYMAQMVGECIVWFSKAISLRDYPNLNSPEPLDRIGLFLENSAKALLYGREKSPALAKLSDWATSTYEFDLQYDAFRPYDRMGHDDIRPSNMAFVKRNGRWVMSGLFDFGIATPSSREREARHMCLFGRPVARETLRVAYGHGAGMPEPMIVQNDISSEDLTNLWASIQLLNRRVTDIEHGEPAGSVPLKLENLYPNFLKWFKWDSKQAA